MSSSFLVDPDARSVERGACARREVVERDAFVADLLAADGVRLDLGRAHRIGLDVLCPDAVARQGDGRGRRPGQREKQRQRGSDVGVAEPRCPADKMTLSVLLVAGAMHFDPPRVVCRDRGRRSGRAYSRAAGG